MGSGENSKLECLKIVQEVIVHKVRRLIYLAFFRKGTVSGKESLTEKTFFRIRTCWIISWMRCWLSRQTEVKR
jgi:hypothetical protein